MKYDVFHYLTFHTKICDVEASSPQEAFAKSQDEAFRRGHSSSLHEFEFAEEQTSALIDMHGDDNYLHSLYMDYDDVRKAEEEYYAKSRNEQHQDCPQGRVRDPGLPQED